MVLILAALIRLLLLIVIFLLRLLILLSILILDRRSLVGSYLWSISILLWLAITILISSETLILTLALTSPRLRWTVEIVR